MKKRTLLTLVLSLAMVLTSISSVFASGPATDVTREEIYNAGVQCIQKIQDGKGEKTAEAIAVQLHKEVVEGKYKLITTDELKAKMEANPKLAIIDTMPAGWWKMRHIPGAKCQVVGAMNGPEFKILPAEKTALFNLAKSLTGAKQVTKWYNKKTKKWTTTKPAKKYRGKSKKVWINKNKTIVVYCGFVGCARSHQAAKYLRSQGFTDVRRYSGGISAWVDAGYDIEGLDVDYTDYVAMGESDPDAWKALGIDAGEITNSDLVIDVRPDAKREADGFVPGAVICPVSNGYTREEAKAINEVVSKQAGGGRVVIVCVTGNKLAQNAMTALSAGGADMSKVTYLKGGFSGDNGWAANYPVVDPEKKSVSVPAWVTKGAGPNGELMMVKDKEGNIVEKCADMTHHVLVNENGGNAPVALLNTKALPLQVYNALKEIGGEPYDKFNAKDQTDEFSLAGKGSGVNVTIDLGDGPKTLDNYFNHVTLTNAELIADEAITAENVPTEPYALDMRFSGGLKNIEDNFSSKSGNLTGCITCTFSCWIGTVSNGAYDYSTQETKVIRENAPVGTPATVVYTIGE